MVEIASAIDEGSELEPISWWEATIIESIYHHLPNLTLKQIAGPNSKSNSLIQIGMTTENNGN
jgi:hypothetical protein